MIKDRGWRIEKERWDGCGLEGGGKADRLGKERDFDRGLLPG